MNVNDSIAIESELDIDEYNSEISPSRSFFVSFIAALIIPGMIAIPFIFEHSLYTAVFVQSVLHGVALCIPYFTKASDSAFNDRECQGVSQILKMLAGEKYIRKLCFSCSSIALDYVRFIFLLGFALPIYYSYIALNIGFSSFEIFLLLFNLWLLQVFIAGIFRTISIQFFGESMNPISLEMIDAKQSLILEYGFFPSIAWSDGLHREMRRVCYKNSDYTMLDPRCVDAAIKLYCRKKNLA